MVTTEVGAEARGGDASGCEHNIDALIVNWQPSAEFGLDDWRAG